MKNFPERKRNRMKGFDYSIAAGYFITICTKDRIPWLGEVIDGEVKLSNVGKIVQDKWH